MENNQNTGLSEDTKTIIVVLLLILVYPVGLILMFVWMKWPMWVKLLVALPTSLIFLAIVGIMVVGVLAGVNPRLQMDKAADMATRNNAMEMVYASERYFAKYDKYPWGNKVGYRTGSVTQEDWFSKLDEDGRLQAYLDKLPVATKLKTGELSLTQTIDGVEVCYQSQAQKIEVCVP
ncbi:MAG: hypothetical protein WAV41_02325 [Microgenomates group bacterium]